jgi:hypothetical protein
MRYLVHVAKVQGAQSAERKFAPCVRYLLFLRAVIINRFVVTENVPPCSTQLERSVSSLIVEPNLEHITFGRGINTAMLLIENGEQQYSKEITTLADNAVKWAEGYKHIILSHLRGIQN